MNAIPMRAVLDEAATLAREFENTPLWQRRNVREGAITIQQQAQRFARANNDTTRADAALWAYEGYILLSSALPDTYRGAAPDERKTGWQTARDISRLFGAERAWIARIRETWPDASATPLAGARTRGLDA